jgi:hypothetical protein
LRRLHAGGIVWSTCAYRNVLVRGRPCRLDLILCDLPWAARAGRAQAGRAAARVDVRDAFFSATSRRLFTPGERLAGLLAYCDGDRRAARRAWRALRARSGRRQMLEKNVVRAVYSYARPALLAAVGGRRVPRVRWSGELTISTQPGPRPASA